MDFAEDARNHTVAAHGVQQTGRCQLRVHDVGDADGDDVYHQHERVEALAAHDHDRIEKAHVRVSIGPVGLHGCSNVGLRHEYHDDEAQCDDDALANVLFGLARFLGEGGYSIETQERERRQRNARSDELRGHFAFLVQRGDGESFSAAIGEEVATKGDEDDQRNDLDDEDDPVHTSIQLDATDVHKRIERDKDDAPQPCRAIGDERHTPVHHHDDEQAGNQNVIQENEPACDKAHMGVDAALHVRVYGARNGEALGHAHVAHRGEDDGHEADDIHQRRHAMAVQLDAAEDGLWGDDYHEENAVQNNVP